MITAAARQAGNSSPGRPDSRLVRRYRRMFLAIVLPLLAIVIVLAVTQYRSQREEVLQQLAEQSSDQVRDLEPLTLTALSLVRLVRNRFETYLAAPPLYSKHRPERLTRRTANGVPDGYTLDGLPEELKAELGQLAWLDRGDAPETSAAGKAVVDMALDFYSMARLVHAKQQHLQWTYYYSANRNVLYSFPWAPSRVLVEDPGFDSLETTFATLPTFRFYRLGSPELNPEGLEYWIQPNVDPTTGQAMVTAAAPIYMDGTFEGVVATDVKLAAFHDALGEGARGLGRMILMTAEGTVLGDSAQSARDALVNVSGVLPGELAPADIEAAFATPGAPYAAAAYTLFVHAVPLTPWKLVYFVSDREVAQHLLPRFIPYLVIVVAVAAAFLLALMLLRRQFIQPAFELVEYIQHGAQEVEPSLPRVPKAWQAVAERLAAAFQGNREANRKLRESESFKSAILENAMLGVVTIDPDGRIVDFNPAAERMFGYSRSSVSGKSFASTIVAPRSRLRFRQLWSRHEGERSTAPDHLEISALRADDAEIAVALSVSAIGSGKQRYLTVFIDDLTEQKRSEEQLARQREALRQSEKMSAMGALLAGVAHELNNPLAILMGRAALLEAKLQQPETKDAAQKIYAAAERCGRIVRTFLSMARQRPPERRPAQLNEVAAGALDLLGYSLRSSGISTVTSFDPALPAVSMDADQVGQIVVNLLVNAEQALAECRDDARRREIRVETRRCGAVIELSVADNGPGVPEALRERIFDPFFTTKPAGSGTGMGLAVSFAIAREHRGDLRLKSSTRGATFVLSLPIGEFAAKPSGMRRVTPDDELFAGHVLIVDDEVEVADVLAAILQSAGFTTTCLGSGRRALEWLRDNVCDIILTDLRMPDLDGPGLWRALREQYPELVSRVAFITGDTLSATVEPFLRSTGQPWLEKPFTPEQVLELVARVETIRG